jgi:hypothetical protein
MNDRLSQALRGDAEQVVVLGQVAYLRRPAVADALAAAELPEGEPSLQVHGAWLVSNHLIDHNGKRVFGSPAEVLDRWPLARMAELTELVATIDRLYAEGKA